MSNKTPELPTHPKDSFARKEELDAFLNRASKIVSPIYLVGGCVRDALLDNPIHDFDMTTPLLPDEVEGMVRSFGRKPYTIGKRFGTIGFKLDGTVVEVTTFRHERYHSKSRHPDVNFVQDLKEDLARRDFTINAIAYNGVLHDPFDGIEDMKTQTLKSVGDPFERFAEDPLRILRAARFSSKLQYEPHDSLHDAASSLSFSILNIAKERWTDELTRLFSLDDPYLGIKFLSRNGLFHIMIPELGYALENLEDEINLSNLLKAKPKDSTYRWAAIFLFTAKKITQKIAISNNANLSEKTACEFARELTYKYARYLKWSKAAMKNVAALCLEQDGHLD